MNKVKSLSLTKMKVAEIDGEHRVTFVASSNKEDRDYEKILIDTFRLPLKGGGEIKVSAIPEDGIANADIPLLTDHNLWEVEKVIGSVRKTFFKDNELIFECGISSRDYAQEMFKLIEEGHLDNAFSIQFRDFDYNFDAKQISNGEIIEVSLVTRGSNKEARVLDAKSTKGETMDSEPTQTPDENQVEETPAAGETKAETPAEETQPEETEAPAEDGDKPAETETPAEDINNKEEKEEKSMNPELAKKLVKEPSQTETSENAGAKAYLGSKAAVKDFAEILMKNATGAVADVREAWGAHLATKGITDTDNVLLPHAIVNEIKDTVEKNGTILNLVDQTGLTVFNTALNLTGVDVEAGRAKGHKGNGATKAEQTISLSGRVLRAQYIYKYLTVPKEMIRETQDTGALVEYVLKELPKRVVAEIERAIVIGDGREANDDNKITSIVAIKTDAATTNSPYATTYTPAAGENPYEAVINAATELETEGKVYLVTSKKNKAALKLAKIGDHYVFGTGGKISDAIEVEDIIAPAFMKNDTNFGYLVVFSSFKTVGDKNSEAYTNFALKENKNEFLEEQYIGGGLADYRCAVAIAPLTAAANSSDGE